MEPQEERNNYTKNKHWIIVLILLGSCYGIYTGIRDLLRSQEEREKWTEEEKKALFDNCIRDSKDMAIKYPELTKDYCECSNERVQSRFTKYEYIDIIEKPIPEQMKVLLPVFQDCLTTYQNKIKEKGK